MNELMGNQTPTPLTDFSLSLWPYGTPLVDGNYVAIGPDGSVRLYNQDQFNPVNSMSIYNCWNLGGIKTFKLPSLSIANGTSQGLLTCFARDSSNQTYLMANNSRYTLNSTANIQTSSASDSAITRLPLKSLTSILRSPTGELSTLESNLLRSISNMQDFEYFSYTTANITSLPKEAYGSFQKGARKLAPGVILVNNTGAAYVVSGNTTSLYIGSMKLLNDFGFKWPSTIPSPQKDVNAYPSSGSLPTYLKVSNDAYLVDGGKRHLINQSLDTAVGITRNNLLNVDNYFLRNTSANTLSRFIKSSNSGNIYYLESGQKRLIKSWETFLQMNGGASGPITVLTPERVNAFPSGPAL